MRMVRRSTTVQRTRAKGRGGRRRVLAVAAAALATASIGCAEGGDDQRTDTFDASGAASIRAAMPPELVSRLDRGSAAFREDDYDAALEHYMAATEIDETSAPAWYGVYMAHRALGNAAEAEAALERTRGLEPRASIIHPTGQDTAR